MKPSSVRLARIAGLGLLILVLAGCSAHNTRRENTVIGAGAGAIAGALFSDGDPLAMLGGAAAGGVLGNVLTDDRRSYSRSYNRSRSYRAQPPRRHSRVVPRYRSTPRYNTGRRW
ncbi:MAG: glycine zipper 2TM domain-containing protein [Castellaniella sp.]